MLAECLVSWTGAETIEAQAAVIRAAELMNLVQAFLTQKK